MQGSLKVLFCELFNVVTIQRETALTIFLKESYLTYSIRF